MWMVVSLLYSLFLHSLQSRHIVHARPIPLIMATVDHSAAQGLQNQRNFRREDESGSNLSDFGDSPSEYDSSDEEKDEVELDFLLDQELDDGQIVAEHEADNSSPNNSKKQEEKTKMTADPQPTYHAANYGGLYGDYWRSPMPVFPSYYRQPSMPFRYMHRAFQPIYSPLRTSSRQFPEAPPNYQPYMNGDSPLNGGAPPNQEMPKPLEQDPPSQQEPQHVTETMAESSKEKDDRQRSAATPTLFLALSKIGKGSLIVVRKVSQFIGINS